MNNNNNDIGGGAALIHILLDLGPACTTNAGTLREALRLVTQKLPSPSSSVENNNTWKEVGVARLLHFFAAVGSNAKGKDNNNLSSAFINVDFNNKGQTNSGDWNLEVISQVLSSDYTHLNWAKIGRSLDFPEFKVRDTRHLEVLLGLFRQGSQQQQLPLDVLTAEAWQNKVGQLSILQ